MDRTRNPSISRRPSPTAMRAALAIINSTVNPAIRHEAHDVTAVRLAEIIEAETAPRSGDWQPIDMAPKDGTVILSANTTDQWVAAGQWNKGAGWYNQFEHAKDGDCEIYPSHWMPFPDPQPES